jgi:hypothetical protein
MARSSAKPAKKKASRKQCYHCKKKLSASEPHNCWTTTEEALTRDLEDDLKEAWLRIREVASELGEQRIYASHKSIMFSRSACYLFVRPKPNRLEVCLFLPRQVKHSLLKSAQPTTKVKVSHLFHIVHRDQVEEPLTDWIREAFDFSKPRVASSK